MKALSTASNPLSKSSLTKTPIVTPRCTCVKYYPQFNDNYHAGTAHISSYSSYVLNVIPRSLALAQRFFFHLFCHTSQLITSLHASFSWCSRSHHLRRRFCDYMLLCCTVNTSNELHILSNPILAHFECNTGNLNDYG